MAAGRNIEKEEALVKKKNEKKKHSVFIDQNGNKIILTE